MIFFGAESGSDWVLKEMQKGITTEADADDGPSRTRQFGIIPEFSFVIGNPGDPERDTRETVQLHPQTQDESIPTPRSSCSTTHPAAAGENVRRC